MRRPTIAHYSVEFEDGAGLLRRVHRILESGKVDPSSVVTAQAGQVTAVQFLAAKDDGLRRRLEKLGARVHEDLVFQVELPHHHRELHKLTQALAELGINILTLYTKLEDGGMRIIMTVDQPANAVAAAAKLGFDPDYRLYEREAPVFRRRPRH